MKAEMAKEKIVGFKLYSHYLWFAIAGAFILPAVFLAQGMAMLLFGFQMWLINIVNLLICLSFGSAIVHASCWSVIGDRDIVKRSIFSLGFVLIVFAGTTAGYVLILQGEYFAIMAAQMAMLLALPLIVAAQVPFWFMRGLFGWQFVREGEQPVAISLKQLFLITLVFGIAFAMPSIAGNVYASGAAANHLPIGGTHSSVEFLADGSIDRKEIEITSDNRPEFLLEDIKQAKEQINYCAVFGSMALAVLSLLSIPILWFAFRLCKRKAVIYSALYGGLLYCLAALGYIPFFGWRYFLYQISLFFVFGTALCVFLIIAPLLISRSKGIWLSTGRVSPADVEQVAGPVVDPLA